MHRDHAFAVGGFRAPARLPRDLRGGLAGGGVMANEILPHGEEAQTEATLQLRRMLRLLPPGHALAALRRRVHPVP